VKKRIALCNECDGEVWFDAYVTASGEVVATFDNAYCPICDGESGRYNYRYEEVSE
jgi:hypothetical protein